MIKKSLQKNHRLLKKTSSLKNKKIVMLLTNDFTHDSRVLKEAMTAKKAGMRVTVIAKKSVKTSSTEILNGIKIYRVETWLDQLKNRVVRKKVFKNNFTASGDMVYSGDKNKSLFFNILTVWNSYLINKEIYKRAIKIKPDMIHANDVDTLLAGSWLQKKGVELIYDSHELWSEVALPPGRSWLRPIYRLIERLVMPKISKIITVNNSLAVILEKKYRKRTLALYNFPDFNDPVLGQNIISQYRKRGKKIIIYIGNLSYGRGLEKIIESVKFLPKNYLLIFLGDGAVKNKLLDLIEKNKLKGRIFIFKPVKPNQVLTSIRGADIGLNLIENVSLSYYYSTPNKLFQYIAAEIPVLASNFPEMSRIVLEDEIGETVNPSWPGQIAQKILKMARSDNQKKYRQNLKGLAAKKYNWALEAKKLIKFYDL